MNTDIPNGRWQEILRRAAVALQGRIVGVWESGAEGEVRPIAASLDPELLKGAAGELQGVLDSWRVKRRPGQRWLASRLSSQQWAVAKFPDRVPHRAPSGFERRSAERVTLELAGAALTLVEPPPVTPKDRPVQISREVTVAPPVGTAPTTRAVEEYFDQSTSPLHWLDAEGTILRANQAELAMLGYETHEYIGRNLAEFHVDRERLKDLLGRLAAGETLINEHVQVRHKDGTVRTIALICSASFENGRFVRTRCLSRDTTKEEETAASLIRYKAMVESADDAILSKTLDGVITSWNAGAAAMYGYTAEEVIGKSIQLLIPEDRPEEMTSILQKIRDGQRTDHYETQRVRKDGTRLEVSVTVSPIMGGSKVIGASAIARDITEKKKAEQQLLHGALHDPLTDLPNRALFLERMAEALDRARRDPAYQLALLFLDFDGFKVINDSLGHNTGDRLLRQIAARLRTFIRPGDMVARLGGDEFTLLLDDVEVGDVERAAKRVQQGLAHPFQVDEQEIYATASIGVALADASYQSPEDLLRDADIAMYRAKAAGRARYQVFDVAMRDRAHTRFWMENDLRGALERGEFRLVFQPIVQLETGKVHAFEALLRWNHPERGVIHPMEFIPLAEETRQIVPIGAWVLREACWHVRRWQRACPAATPVRISVNLSAQQLGPNLIGEVKEAIAEASIEPRNLRLEITESVLVDTVESSASLLHQLRDLRVQLHMDDFGTGYSSLGYLPRFPLSAIKIDRSFVHRMGMRRTDLEVVRSIVDLAKNLGMSVVAEGVETEAQKERLIAFGCPLAQGYLFAQPLEPAAAGALLGAQA